MLSYTSGTHTSTGGASTFEATPPADGLDSEQAGAELAALVDLDPFAGLRARLDGRALLEGALLEGALLDEGARLNQQALVDIDGMDGQALAGATIPADCVADYAELAAQWIHVRELEVELGRAKMLLGSGRRAVRREW